MAKDEGLDLIEISPKANPPVCKIMDMGKYKYDLQKKANLAKKKQKIVSLKEIKLRPGTESHDYNFKIKNAKKFLTKGDKVKFTIRFKGREFQHSSLYSPEFQNTNWSMLTSPFTARLFKIPTVLKELFLTAGPNVSAERTGVLSIE